MSSTNPCQNITVIVASISILRTIETYLLIPAEKSVTGREEPIVPILARKLAILENALPAILKEVWSLANVVKARGW